jgi:hypothetical protein
VSARRASAVALAVAAFVAAGCGGSPSARERVSAYLVDAGGVQTRWSRAFDTANHAYAEFAAGRLKGDAAARQMAKVRDDVRALRAALAALTPPGEARALHAKLLRAFDLDLALATETAQLATYLPAESAALARLPAANRRLSRRLAAASRDPAAQARALGAFKLTLDRTVRDLRTLTPPPVLRVGHRDRIDALARTAALSGRLRRALRAGDAVRAAHLLDQLERTPPEHRTLAREAVEAYNRRSLEVRRAVQDVRRSEASLNRRFAAA